MEFTELSLAPTKTQYCFVDKSSSNISTSPEPPADDDDSNSSFRKKRKFLAAADHLLRTGSSQTSIGVDLQLNNDPLPRDWEQCLDLEQSGRMYYLNRKTLRKSWNWPKDHQKLDLELNISSLSSNNCFSGSFRVEEDPNKKQQQHSSSSGTSMVALACLNCHLLVILSRSSPACPNCKYVHSLSTLQAQPVPMPLPMVSTTINSLDTHMGLN